MPIFCNLNTLTGITLRTLIIMTEVKEDSIIPDESILSKIYIIRGKKVMLDWDLAGLYGVETKYLKDKLEGILFVFRRILCLS